MGTIPSPAKRTVSSALTLASGIALAATPTAMLAVSSHVFSITDQALLVVAISIATLAGQLVSAVTVESELAAGFRPDTLGAPRWLVALAVIAAAAMALAPTTVWVVGAASAALFAALESGRVASVAAHRDRREMQGSLVFLASLAAAVVLAILGANWAFSVIAAGAAFVVVWRAVPTWRSQRPHATISTRNWLGVDALAAGITFPLVTSLTLALAGAEVTAVFGMVASVSAIAALPGSYLKMRLLGEHSRHEILVSAAAGIASTVALLIAQQLGLINLVFGASWAAGVSVAMLAVASVWRLSSLVTVIPFASLRRHGRVRRMVPVRFVGAAVTVGLVAIVAPSGALLVFVVLAAMELATALGYWAVDRPANAIS